MKTIETRTSPMHGPVVASPAGDGLRLVLPKKPNLNLIRHARAGEASLVNAQIAMGADVNVVDGDGMTALHHAAARGARPCIRILVASKKCDFLMRDKWGRTASDLAIEWGRDFAVARLLSKHQMRQAHARGVPPVVLET